MLRRRLWCALLVSLFGVQCENKYRATYAPEDMRLPRPDRGPCVKEPPPILYLRLPRFMREDLANKRFCQPLDELIKREQLGMVQSKAPPPRSEKAFSGCAIYAADADRAISLVTQRAIELDVPAGTVIEELCGGVGSVHTVRPLTPVAAKPPAPKRATVKPPRTKASAHTPAAPKSPAAPSAKH